MDSRITVDPNICRGQACITGTPIPEFLILQMLANGDSASELMEEYPSLSQSDINACLDYAASLAEEQVTPLEALSSDAWESVLVSV